MENRSCTTIILDLGDVLFTWKSTTPTSVSPRTLHDVVNSATWGEHECGKLTRRECYERVSAEFSVEPGDLEAAFDHARESLVFNVSFSQFIRSLKNDLGARLRVYAMTNVAEPDYTFLRNAQDADWSIFDAVFTSFAAGMRKPSLKFYERVIQQTGCDPRATVFVDDKLDNVLSAQSLGMHGVVFDSQDVVRMKLCQLLYDPVERGVAYLRRNAGMLDSVTNTGVVVEDNFAQLLIVELMDDRDLVRMKSPANGKWNYFKNNPVLTTATYPCDMDTTSVGLIVSKTEDSVAGAIMDEILQYLDRDGIVQTYFDSTRSRRDPIVCANVLSLFDKYGRGHELSATRSWLLNVLRYRAYLGGTRYYKTPECFLYFVGRMVQGMERRDEEQATFTTLLKERLRERLGASGDALALGMRLVACASVGIRAEVDLGRLLDLQLENGSWGPGTLCRYGVTGVSIGNTGLTTAFAVKAIQTMQDFEH